MTGRAQPISRWALPVAIAGLAVVLLLSSVRTLRELDDQKSVYLRSRTANLAGRLENLPGSEPETSVLEALGESEPYLVDVRLIQRGDSLDQPPLAAIWNGEQLYRTEFLQVEGVPIFRAYVPFHSGMGLRIAKIDLDARAADFLSAHARHNVLLAAFAGMVLVLLSIYAVWASRRAAEFQVRHLELEHLAHIGKMSAVLAHEIRNPLGTIKGFTQLAGEQADAKIKGLLGPVLDETLRLENLVNDLLVYGRPPAPSLRIVEWARIRERLIESARHQIGDQPIRFRVSAEPWSWKTDPALLEQALLNLVRNAIEAAAGQPAAEVSVALESSCQEDLTICVADNGPGISVEVRPRLFEPFFTTKTRGTGLGLSITGKLVSSLGGTVELCSATPHGTKAVLRFRGASVHAAGAD